MTENTELSSAFGLVQVDDVNMWQSVGVAVRAGKISMNGSAGVVVAGSVEFGNAYAGIVASREVCGEKVESIILLSRRSGRQHSHCD